MSFTHLNIHSGYSLMKSTVSIDKLVKRASELGFKSLALTDDAVLYGAVSFYKACRSHNIKPIIGMTVDLLVNEELVECVLLARSNQGYKHLLHISTDIQVEGATLSLEQLKAYKDGLIVIIKSLKKQPLIYLENGQYDELHSLYSLVLNQLGSESVYLSVERYGSQYDERLERLKSFTEIYRDVALVALTEVRFLEKKDVHGYECLRAMEQNELWSLREPDAENKDKFLLTKEELKDRFSFWPDALLMNEKIANECHVTIEMKTPRLPKFPLKAGESARQVLKDKCLSRLPQLYENVTEDIKDRLTYELNIIDELGFNDYFLIVADFVSFAKGKGILVGPGRGSAAGSLVSYVLGITDVDPIKHKLIFERFLNPERVSLPDIDIDFSDERRDEVIHYVKEKYGQAHVAQIVTFGTFAARSLLRELMKTLDVDERDQAYLLKHIPVSTSKSIIRHIEESADLKQYVKKSQKLRLLSLIAQTLEGLPRHTSTHAAGIVITEEPLVSYVPLLKGQDDVFLTQYSMNELEAIGLLKIDLLGLRNLSLIEKIVKTIKQVHQLDVDLRSIKENDETIFKLLQEAKTNGIFQLESDGMKQLLRRLKPTEFDDIVALNALYRPGPMEQIPTYIARKHGQEQATYLHEDLRPILHDTYGVLIYQEQIMQIAHKLANFTLGEADLLRRAMSKKEHNLMKEQKSAFIAGCLENGYSEQIAEQLFSWIEKFADYGFNKSHSVAYSKIAYQLSYLKAHFPNAFFAQLLSSIKGDTAKFTQYIKEAKALNVLVLRPSINKSFGRFSIEGNDIRIGLLAIKGVGFDTVKEIIRVRKEKHFTDLFDFCLRVSQRIVKRSTIETLILAGVFDELYDNRASLLASLDEALERAELFGSKDGQTSLFMSQISMRDIEYHKIDDFPDMKKLADEKELLGIYISDHPLSHERRTLSFNDFVMIEETKFMKMKKRVNIVSIVERISKIRTKRGESMAFLTVNDETGDIDVVVFPELYRQVGRFLKEDLIISGDFTIDEHRGKVQLIANKLTPFNRDDLQAISKDQLFIRFTGEMGQLERKKLQEVLQKHPGDTMIIVYYEKERKSYRLGRSYLIEINDHVIEQLKQIFGRDNVVLQEGKK